MTAVALQRTQPAAGRRGQRGAVLVVGLIFLALMTLIGVTAYSVATQEERMAGNARDRLRAFEAAEAALRRCEHLLRTLSDADALGYPPAAYPEMYAAPAGGAKEKWETIYWSKDPTHQLKGAEAVPGVAEQPRCIVQRLSHAAAGNVSQRAELPQSTASAWAYQVTARGVGANSSAVVLLQSAFVRD
jgi:type IV pilus assembly protein PilX